MNRPALLLNPFMIKMVQYSMHVWSYFELIHIDREVVYIRALQSSHWSGISGISSISTKYKYNLISPKEVSKVTHVVSERHPAIPDKGKVY